MSQTCKLLFETISDPTTLHFTAEDELTGFDLEVIFALIIQLKHFFFAYLLFLVQTELTDTAVDEDLTATEVHICDRMVNNSIVERLVNITCLSAYLSI